MNITWLKFKGSVKGIFTSIPYNPLLESGDSSPYFGTYEGQRYGKYDTSLCWDYSGCELAETRLETIWKLNLIPQESKDWLTKNGYIDTDGDFYLSRRWVAILSGVRDGGNNQLDFWRVASVAGLIPHRMLPYKPEDAQKWLTQGDFNNDYFNPQIITKEMEQMGLEFLKRFTILAENIPGGTLNNISISLQTYLKEGSLQIGHPVPQDGTWNQTFINTPVGRLVADHATELYKFDPSQAYPYFIYDSYEPHLKQLQNTYYLPYITRVQIKAKELSPVPVASWTTFWQNIFAWLTGKTLPYPTVPIGSVNSV